ncbi:MAG: tyrosine-type recombinase/integrase [Dermatophilaceae bacterium]
MKARGRRGFGYIRRLPSKRWQASYIGPDLARHAAPTTFDTKGDAEGWLGREHHLVSVGQWQSPAQRAEQHKPNRTAMFAAYAESWLKGRDLKPKTREGYEHLLCRYLVPGFGEHALTGITPADVRRWWGSLDRQTPTVNARAYTLLKTIMNTAVADDVIAANPCRLRGASNTQRSRDVKPATVAQLDVIAQNMPENRRAVIALCAWCALRIGEVLELRRGDVDLEQATVSVARAVTWVKGAPVVGSPKSAAGTRQVAVPPHVMPVLEQHLTRWTGPTMDALLFPARGDNRHLQPSTFHATWRKARAAAGRPDLRVHDLRHTGATLAAMTGATLADLQLRLGHSSVNAALRYQHAAQGRDAQIAAALSALALPQ